MSKQDKLIPELRFPEFNSKGEWVEKKISELGETVNGLTGKSGEDFGAGKPFVTYKQVFDSSIIDFEKCGKVKISANENQNTLQRGDVLFTTSSETQHEVGFASVLVDSPNESTYLNSFCFSLRPFNIKDTLPEFSRYLFHSPVYRKAISALAQGSTRYNISKGAFLNLKLPIPKPNEQFKIASCLSSLDQVISAHSQKLELLKNNKKGLMQILFPIECEKVPRYRFNGFEKDGDWVEKSIQSLIHEKFIVSHLDGNHGSLYPKAEEFSKEGIPYITANDFISGLIDFSNCKFLPLNKAKQFKKGVAKNGDILFAHNATVGPVAKLVTSFPYVILSTTATYFRCDNENLINDFLLYALISPSFIKQYTRVMTQSTRNQVPITTQREFFLQLPLPNEQKKVASSLSSLDALITGQIEIIEQLKLHKKGLMQGLFPNIKD